MHYNMNNYLTCRNKIKIIVFIIMYFNRPSSYVTPINYNR